MSELVNKASLSSGKEVDVKHLEMKHYRQASQVAAAKIGKKGNEYSMSLALQDELMKILVVAIDGQRLSAIDRERLDTLLTTDDYRQVVQVIELMIGDVEAPKVEQVSLESIGGSKSPGLSDTVVSP
jgi:hypothetical protein